jgi:hypothetical protein
MKSRLAARAAATVAMIGLLTVGGALAAAPANAGTNCPAGNHCVFFFDFNSSHHNYFNSDPNFTDDIFIGGNGFGKDVVVNDETFAASNSSTSNLESHYYYDINPTTSSRLVFCVNPGSQVAAFGLSDDGIRGNGVAQANEASALILRNRTPIRCF